MAPRIAFRENDSGMRSDAISAELFTEDVFPRLQRPHRADPRLRPTRQRSARGVIIQFVVKTLVLDWGLDPQQAVSAVSFGAANTPVTGVGGEHPAIDGVR